MSQPIVPMGGDAADTVVEALQLLAEAGYNDRFDLDDAGICCHACGSRHSLTTAVTEKVFRFEGPSDPADEAIVLGVRCPTCGARGSVVSGYGPSAEPDSLPPG